MEEMEQWLEETDYDPGYQLQSVEKIVQQALKGEKEQETDSEEDRHTSATQTLISSFIFGHHQQTQKGSITISIYKDKKNLSPGSSLRWQTVEN